MEKTTKFIAKGKLSKGLTLSIDGSVTYDNTELKTKKALKEALLEHAFEEFRGQCPKSAITIQLV